MIPDDPRAAVALDAEEHVADIMFDPQDRPDPDCVLCKAGLEFGVWALFGIDDPFAASVSGDT